MSLLSHVCALTVNLSVSKFHQFYSVWFQGQRSGSAWSRSGTVGYCGNCDGSPSLFKDRVRNTSGEKNICTFLLDNFSYYSTFNAFIRVECREMTENEGRQWWGKTWYKGPPEGIKLGTLLFMDGALKPPKPLFLQKYSNWIFSSPGVISRSNHWQMSKNLWCAHHFQTVHLRHHLL